MESLTYTIPCPDFLIVLFLYTPPFWGVAFNREMLVLIQNVDYEILQSNIREGEFQAPSENENGFAHTRE